MTRLTLSTSFRCPRSVVRNAHWRVPHMTYPEWAVEGEVKTLFILYAKQIAPGSVFICRNNAPLFAVALNFLKAGIGVKILGNDIGPGLIRVLQKLGDQSIPQVEALRLLAAWYEERKKKTRGKAGLEDRYQCLKYFLSEGQTLGESIAYADHLFKASGPIQFTSGHKSKGLEWDTVYHLDSYRLNPEWARSAEAAEQENNLKYVIETRAKRALYFINMEQIIYDNPPAARNEGVPGASNPVRDSLGGPASPPSSGS